MESLGRQNFEDSWRVAFNGAEGQSPSESVWLAIDGALTATENATNKTRVVFYQRIAASLLLLTTISMAISYWRWSDKSSTHAIAHEAREQDSNKTKPDISNEEGNDNRSIQKRGKVTPPLNTNTKVIDEKAIDNNPAMNEAIAEHVSTTGNEILYASDSSAYGSLAETQALEKTHDMTAEEEKALVAMLRSQIEETIIPEKKSVTRDNWVAVGASGGSFAPHATTSGGAAAFMDQLSNASAYNSVYVPVKKPTVGTSFSFGVTAGKQLSRKWLVQTGVTYWKQRMDYQSDVTQLTGNQASAFSPDYVSKGAAQIAFTAPYDVTSTAEFLSIPIQTGYVLFDRKVGWILHAGVSTDIFLNNTLSDNSGRYKSYSQDGGESTLYRTVSWSAMAGTEVNLRLNQRYRIALVPGIRYSFTNIYNTESGASRPIVFDLGLRFRYIFK